VQIGELAEKAGIQPGTVRYYERIGLVPEPERTQGNYRVYTEEHLERLRFIRNCRLIGMALEEVRTLLHYWDNPDLTCHEINQMLDSRIAGLEAQLDELHRLEVYLRELRSRCDHPSTAGDCGILVGLAEDTPPLRDGEVG
jgi:Cd(II)/Pb(II)-responsive transcriptional regulator